MQKAGSASVARILLREHRRVVYRLNPHVSDPIEKKNGSPSSRLCTRHTTAAQACCSTVELASSATKMITLASDSLGRRKAVTSPHTLDVPAIGDRPPPPPHKKKRRSRNKKNRKKNQDKNKNKNIIIANTPKCALFVPLFCLHFVGVVREEQNPLRARLVSKLTSISSCPCLGQGLLDCNS